MNLVQYNDTIQDLEIQKRTLEIEKLQLENQKIISEQNQFKKSWIRKPEWWSALVPLIIGAGTIYIAFATGFISVARLENEKEELSRTIKVQKDSITRQSKEILTQKDSINQIIKVKQSLAQNNQQLEGRLNSAIANRNSLVRLRKQEELDRINNEIANYESNIPRYKKLDSLLFDSVSPSPWWEIEIKRDCKMNCVRS